MVVIRGRLTPEVGAVVQRALEAAADRLCRETVAAATGDAMSEELTPAQRRADAIGWLAESALAADFDGGTAGDRYQVVLHVNADAPVDDPIEAPAAAAAADTFDGALEVDHGALYVSTETSRRLACDASMVHMRHEAEGDIVDVGRKTRTIPSSIRRALAARDTNCRFPGCTARRCDAHHVRHWADGGATCLDNLLRRCRRHHRAVHEAGFSVIRQSDGTTTFVRPDGMPLDAAPAPPRWQPVWHEAPALTLGTPPTWDGTPLNITWAIDVLRPSSSGRVGAC